MPRRPKKLGHGNRSGINVTLEAECIDEVKESALRFLGDVFSETAEDAADWSRANHWFNNQTGNTEANIQARVAPTQTGHGVAFEVGTTTYYAEHLEDRESFLGAGLEHALIDIDNRIIRAITDGSRQAAKKKGL